MNTLLLLNLLCVSEFCITLSLSVKFIFHTQVYKCIRQTIQATYLIVVFMKSKVWLAHILV